jgi:hypothetical protein
MNDADSRYPDISDILARKASGRRQRAALSFAEKLAIVDALRARVAPLVRARKLRREQQPVGWVRREAP